MRVVQASSCNSSLSTSWVIPSGPVALLFFQVRVASCRSSTVNGFHGVCLHSTASAARVSPSLSWLRLAGALAKIPPKCSTSWVCHRGSSVRRCSHPTLAFMRLSARYAPQCAVLAAATNSPCHCLCSRLRWRATSFHSARATPPTAALACFLVALSAWLSRKRSLGRPCSVMRSDSWLMVACVSACGGGRRASSVGLELRLNRLLPHLGAVAAWVGGGPPWRSTPGRGPTLLCACFLPEPPRGRLGCLCGEGSQVVWAGVSCCMGGS